MSCHRGSRSLSLNSLIKLVFIHKYKILLYRTVCSIPCRTVSYLESNFKKSKVSQLVLLTCIRQTFAINNEAPDEVKVINLENLEREKINPRVGCEPSRVAIMFN